MRVLFVVPYFGLPGILSDTLAGQLLRRGYDVSVVGFARNKEKIIFSESNNLRFYFVDAISISIPNFITEFPYFLHFENIVKQYQPDIIHVNTLPFLTSLQAIAVARRMRIPGILHVHGVIGMRNWLLDTAQRTFIRTVLRKAFHDATLIICLTKSDSLEVQRLGCPHEKIRIIPNGVDIEKFKPSNRRLDDLIFWGGRFIPQKGLEYLIEAFALITKERPKAKLMMTGNGPLFPKIYGLVKRYKLEKNVLFRGYVARNTMPDLLGVASVYVLPSLKEGMPYALLEAMACGLPVIGSNIPGVNDVIVNGENGLLVPPRDPKALAEAILTLLNDVKMRKKLGQNARELIVKKYNWNKIIPLMEKVYREAIKENTWNGKTVQNFREVLIV